MHGFQIFLCKNLNLLFSQNFPWTLKNVLLHTSKAKQERQQERGRKWWILHLLVCTKPCQLPGLSQVEGGSLELHMSLPHRWERPLYLSHHLFPRRWPSNPNPPVWHVDRCHNAGLLQLLRYTILVYVDKLWRKRCSVGENMISKKPIAHCSHFMIM